MPLLFLMPSARWSKGSADRHGVDDDSPRLAHVVADLLQLVLMRRGSRSEEVLVSKDDFVPAKTLAQLLQAFLPSAFRSDRHAKSVLTTAGKLIFGAEFKVTKNSNGYYRTSAGAYA